MTVLKRQLAWFSAWPFERKHHLEGISHAVYLITELDNMCTISANQLISMSCSGWQA